MKIKRRNGKKLAVSCAAVCLAGTLMWNGTGMTAWAAPSTGSAVSDNTRVRSAIGGDPIGSLNANQEVQIKSEQTASDGHTWYEITFDWNGQQTDGWVRSDMISSGTGNTTTSTNDTNTNDTTADNAADNNANNDNTADRNTADNANTADNSNANTAAPAANTTAATAENGTDEGADNTATFLIDGKNYEIADRFPNSKIPEGFEETTITYAGAEVPAAKMTTADVFLLYLQNTEDSNDKNVFVFDSERDQAIPFVSVATQDGFVVVTDIPSDVEAGVSDYYLETACAFAEGSIMAYQVDVAGDTVGSDAAISDFYYVYGVKSDGTEGWYTYDAAGQTLQRSTANMQYIQPAEQPDESDEKDTSSVFELDSMTRMLTAGLGLIALLLLILLIVVSARYRRLRKYLDNNEDFAEDDFDDEFPEEDTTFGVDIAGSTVDVVDFDSEPKEQPKKKKKSRKAKKEEKQMQEDFIEVPEETETVPKQEAVSEEPVEDAAQIELPEEPAAPESNPETEKLVADLKKMILEVETTLQPGNDEEDEFFDEEDPVIPEQPEEKNSEQESKKDSSWDDIEFL